MKYFYIFLCCIIASSSITAQEQNITVIDSLFSLKKSELSSENTEFGAVLTNNNTIYYTRANSNLSAEDQNTSDLNIYQAVLNNDQSITDIKALDGINSKWHDGPLAITTDGKTMYFASESFNVKKGFKKEKTPAKIYKKGKIYLFKASKIDGEWTHITPLPFNSIDYSTRNPSLSTDGKTLYFSSDMPGGLGGEDIWKVSVDQNSYGTPENLGAPINSSDNESFPFITSENVLYFSSNVSGGFGGLDVYKTNLNKTTNIVNIGLPVNSEKDDFSFSLHDDKKMGFVTSNREDSDDIYLIAPICRLIASITVSDRETGAAISNAKLDIIKVNKLLQSLTTTLEPTVSKLECETTYNLAATKEGYEDGTATIEATTDGGELAVNIELTPIKTPIITETQVVLQPIYFEFDKSNITSQGANELDKLVTVMKENPDMIILVKSHTDNRGPDEYNKNLSDRRSQATVTYVVSKGISEDRIFGKGFGESDPKIICDTCTEEENSQNRRSEFMIVK